MVPDICSWSLEAFAVTCAFLVMLIAVRCLMLRWCRLRAKTVAVHHTWIDNLLLRHATHVAVLHSRLMAGVVGGIFLKVGRLALGER